MKKGHVRKDLLDKHLSDPELLPALIASAKSLSRHEQTAEEMTIAMKKQTAEMKQLNDKCRTHASEATRQATDLNRLVAKCRRQEADIERLTALVRIYQPSDLTSAQITTIRRAIVGAINIGAPLYNEGNIRGCAQLYETTTKTCMETVGDSPGLAHSEFTSALEFCELDSPTDDEKAWKLRRAFDAILEHYD